VRLGLFLVGLLSTALLPAQRAATCPAGPATHPSESWHHVFTAWERHDALWFLRIASDRLPQDDASAAFFPLYPLLSRGARQPRRRPLAARRVPRLEPRAGRRA
jgi:hypothetical protein